MAEHTLSQDHHPTVRHDDLHAIGAALPSTLSVRSDLRLVEKHAHWNVIGPNVRRLPVQRDEMVDARHKRPPIRAQSARWCSGMLSKAARPQLLSAARRRRPTSARAATHAVVAALTAILTNATERVRGDMEHADTLDVVTGDILHSIVAGSRSSCG